MRLTDADPTPAHTCRQRRITTRALVDTAAASVFIPGVPMPPALPRTACALLLAALLQPAWADLLAAPPPRWQHLTPVAEVDVSGAEPLMQQAIAAARQELADLLAQPPGAAPAADQALAAAWGRLGALFLLLEVEAPADACFRNAIALDPTGFRWPYLAGHLAVLAGNLDRALGYLEAARAIDPDYAPLYLRLGKAHLDRSELPAARATLTQVGALLDRQQATMAPAALADAQRGLRAPADYYLAQVALLERRPDDAIALLDCAIAANPEATEFWYPLAQAWRAKGDDARAREALARFVLRDTDIADPLLDELQAANRRSLPAFQRGIHAIRQGHYTEAVERFAEGLAVDPDNTAARLSYARALWLAGQPEAAGQELTRVLEQDTGQPLARFLTGVLAAQRGDNGAAAEAWRQTLALDPGHAGALFYLANLDFVTGHFAAAADGYTRALAADSGIAPARLLALVAALHAGEPAAAVAARLTAIAAEPADDPQARYALARLLAAADDPAVRDPARALKLAAQLTVAQPIPPHQRALALAEAANGRFDRATEMLESLLLNAWLAPPAERALMQQELDALRAGRLPTPAWPVSDPLLSPPPFDPLRPFRDYPAAAPY